MASRSETMEKAVRKFVEEQKSKAEFQGKGVSIEEVKEEKKRHHFLRVEFKCDPQEMREVDTDHLQN